MKSRIFFTIVVPTYNRAHLVSKTIDSILCQDYEPFELIVVDDGSTDNTEESLKKYHLDERFQYHRKNNAERGAARNYGLQRAKGEFVFFLDSDDLMLPGHLSYLSDRIQQLDKVPNFVASGFEIINEDGSFNYPGHPFHEGWYSLDVLLKGNYLNCYLAVRRANPNLILFSEDRGLAVMEDWIFLLQNLQNDEIYILDKITINMVEHDERSMTENRLVIEKRKKATNYILSHVRLNSKQKSVICNYTYYNCAVHAIIEGDRRLALKYIVKIFLKVPFVKTFPLIVKLVIGKQAFAWLKKHIVASS